MEEITIFSRYISQARAPAKRPFYYHCRSLIWMNCCSGSGKNSFSNRMEALFTPAFRISVIAHLCFRDVIWNTLLIL